MLIIGEYFEIRDIGENDMDDVFNVYKHCEDFLALGPVAAASKQMVLDDFEISRKEGGTFCGIFIDGKMAGIFDFVLDNYNGNPNHAYLSLLMISDEYRRKGIGKDVVRAVESEILKNRSINAILAGVQVNNKPGIAFWTGMGYKITGGPYTMPDTTVVYSLKKDLP